MRKILLLLATATLCILLLTGCGSTEWTMSDIQLSAQDAAAVDRCLKSKDWQDGLTDCISVRLTDGSGRRVDYCADCGIFNDLGAGRHLKLSDRSREDMNTRLGQYVDLWDRG